VPFLDLAELGFRVARYDQLGSWRSDQPDDVALWNVPRFVDEVEHVRAALDLGRTVTRRAERSASKVVGPADSQVVPYLNRLSDLLWTLARWEEGEHLITKDVITDDRRADDTNPATPQETPSP